MPPVRRLSAILAADVAGYSRLMGMDEEGTHERLQAHLGEMINPKIAEHRGRVVKNTGDGLLAEFASVVEAVRCAVEVQRAMADRDLEMADERRIRFRIGINLGDVIAEEHGIFGDGVNVAGDWKRWLSQVASALAGSFGIRCETDWITFSRIWANKRSKTSLGPCVYSGLGTMPHASRSDCQPGPSHCRCPTSRRSQCCLSPT